VHYLLLIYGHPLAEAPPQTPADAFATWDDATAALRDAGALVAGEGLEDVATATTVRFRSGETLLTDGPFAETKEHLLGFYLVDVANLDAALAWARRMPNVHWGSVEVRPVLETAPHARAA